MRPLRVEIRLATPIVASRPVLFDGLLAALAVNANGGDGSAAERLPLAQKVIDGNWVWAASQIIARAVWRDRHTYIRKADVWGTARDREVGFKGGPKIYQVASGVYKAYQFFRSVQQKPVAVAYCIGDLEQIDTLLSGLKFVGPLRRQGWGEVSSYKIVEDEAALERWKIRPMPAPHKGYYRAMAGLRPPYWNRCTWQAAWLPGRSVLRAVENDFFEKNG